MKETRGGERKEEGVRDERGRRRENRGGEKAKARNYHGGAQHSHRGPSPRAEGHAPAHARKNTRTKYGRERTRRKHGSSSSLMYANARASRAKFGRRYAAKLMLGVIGNELRAAGIQTSEATPPKPHPRGEEGGGQVGPAGRDGRRKEVSPDAACLEGAAPTELGFQVRSASQSKRWRTE